jgi:K+-sensing histidine kinase KdpD
MLWQLAAATAIGSLFYVKRAWSWIRSHIGSSSPLAGGFLFATAFALVATPVTLILCENHPLPRFNDFFLIGIVLTAYLFRWEPSVYLLAISLMVSAWVLPPAGSFQVAGFSDWYRILSFAAVSIILIGLVSRSKARKTTEERAIGYTMQGAANGAD